MCYKHFKEEDFVPDSENKTKAGKPRNIRTLKTSAMPSLYLLGEALDESSISQYEKEPNFDDDSNGSRGVFEPKLEYLQENYYGSNFSTNPWDVSNPEVFLRYCCPECDFQSGELLGFSQHAVMNHILSETLFIDRNSSLIDYDFENENNPNVNSNAAKIKIKSENLESYEMDDMDTNDPFDNEETMDSETNIGVSIKKKKSRKRKKTTMNSSEAKLESEEATNDPPINIKSEIFEADTDTFVENVETLEPETNIEVKSIDVKNQFKERETEKGPFICESCGFITDTRKLLLRHRQITLACRMHINSFKCSYCESKYSMKSKLECHIEAKHPGTSKLEYFCSICGDGFMFQKNMERHLRKHNKPDESVLEEKKTKKCGICGKRYFKNTNLLKHIEKAHEIPRASLHRHMETVNETEINEILEKKEIKKEGKLFKMDLSADQIKHRDDKTKEVQNPEKIDQLCSKCGQYFTSLVDLAHHFFEAHRDLVQDFDCPMCPKIITSKYQGQKGSVELRKLVMHHIKYTHSKETKQCPECKQVMKSWSLKVHRKMYHGIVYKKKDTIGAPPPNADGGFECQHCNKILSSKISKYFLNFISYGRSVTSLVWGLGVISILTQ